MSRRKPFSILCALVLGAVSMPGIASAATLSLTGPAPAQTLGPQSNSNPCIIAGTTCQNPSGFSYTNFDQSGNVSSYNETSPVYTVSQLTGVAGTSFNIAIDVNTAGGSGGHQENLDSFVVKDVTTNTVLYTFTGTPNSANIGNPNSNGNGYGDYLLSTVNLTGLTGTDEITFQAIFSNTSDGAESFFLISGASVVPIPPAALLFGTAMVGLGLLRRRKNKSLATTAA